MLKPEVLEMANELRTILGSIQGAKGVQESFALNYVVLVENDEDKANVDKVSFELSKQAQKMGIVLEIVAATDADIQKAKDLLVEHMKENSTFKS